MAARAIVCERRQRLGVRMSSRSMERAGRKEELLTLILYRRGYRWKRKRKSNSRAMSGVNLYRNLIAALMRRLRRREYRGVVAAVPSTPNRAASLI